MLCHDHAKEGADSSRYATITLNEEPYHALVAKQLCALNIA